MAKLGKAMLFWVEQAFVGRDEIRAPLKTPACERVHLSLYSSLIFQFLSFFKGTAHRVTELLAGRLGRDKVILNHPVASIKQVKIKVTVTILGRHDLLLLMS